MAKQSKLALRRKFKYIEKKVKFSGQYGRDRWGKSQRKYQVVARELDPWEVVPVAAGIFSRGTPLGRVGGELKFDRFLQGAARAKHFPRIIRDVYTTPEDPSILTDELLNEPEYREERNAHWIEVFKR